MDTMLEKYNRIVLDILQEKGIDYNPVGYINESDYFCDLMIDIEKALDFNERLYCFTYLALLNEVEFSVNNKLNIEMYAE
jgi:hypothetical protein